MTEIDTSFSVWILPDSEDADPHKFTGIVDVLKLPTGEVKVANAEGQKFGAYGEVIRMRQENLPE